MNSKPCNLVLTNMNEKDQHHDSSETSTPEEYLTPSGESVVLSDTSAFSFPDIEQERSAIKSNSQENSKQKDKISINYDENLNQSSPKRFCQMEGQLSFRVADSHRNNNLDKHFKALERDMELKPTKLKPEKDVQPSIHRQEDTGMDNDLANIRKKLEERRRKMEMEKKRLEHQWSRQRQAVGKEAFSALFGNETGSGEFRLPLDKEKSKPLQNGKDTKITPSASYYKQDSAIAMEKLFANEELSVDLHPSVKSSEKKIHRPGPPDSARDSGATQPGKSALERKKTSSFCETSTRSKNAEHRHSVDPQYGLSLDRLNSSLSELQGEIMRLSLQQDHIKNLVTFNDAGFPGDAQARKERSTPAEIGQEPGLGRIDINDLERNESGFRPVSSSGSDPSQRPAANSAFRRYSENKVFNPRASLGNAFDYDRGYDRDQLYQDGREQEIVDHQGNIPYPHAAIIPAINPYPFLPPVPPSPYYPYGYNPYYSPYAQPHFGMRNRQHYRNYDNKREIPLRRDHSLGGIQDSSSSSRRPDRKESVSASRSSHTALRQGETRLPRPSSVVSDYYSTSQMSSFDRSPSNYDISSFQPAPFMQAYSPQHQSFSSAAGEPHLVRPLMSSRFYPPGSCQMPGDANFDDGGGSVMNFDDKERCVETRSSQNETSKDDEQVKSVQQAEFFVVNLEAPKRPKPEIGLQRKNKLIPSSSQTSFSPLSSAGTAVTASAAAETASVASSGKEDDAPEVVLGFESVEPEMVRTLSKSEEEKLEASSVGFVIEEAMIDPSLTAEVERKKMRMAELHQKRKDEMEAKKNIINKDQLAKKEQLRLKEEKAQQKKSEDKQRRDLIFQKYLQRKGGEASETNSDDDATKHHSSNNNSSQQQSYSSRSTASKLRPPSQPRGQRPRSQLVVSCNNKEAVHSKFSDDCAIIITAVRSQPNMTGSKPSSPEIGRMLEAADNAKKEKYSRFLSCGSETGGEDGSGLKLFVKPNQKSNKNIIINAIKDCCLAGTVNQDLKNRVLEEVNKSDSKHFVVLFRDAGLQYRGLYSYNPDRQEVFKIHGVGPKQLVDKTMEKFFKYNSGSKNFSEVTSTKHLSSTIDGVTIPSCLWTKKQPASATTPKKTT